MVVCVCVAATQRGTRVLGSALIDLIDLSVKERNHTEQVHLVVFKPSKKNLLISMQCSVCTEINVFI